ncbi:MAG: hypothetical protein ACLFR2_03395 [Candidatus Kapaibacterium sp.]
MKRYFELKPGNISHRGNYIIAEYKIYEAEEDNSPGAISAFKRTALHLRGEAIFNYYPVNVTEQKSAFRAILEKRIPAGGVIINDINEGVKDE